ncbi:MAG: glycosyltransferase family 2 protein [Kiritimatiellia bacterium]
MNAVPRTSVVVCCYNHGAFIEQRLESIFRQTDQDFEVLVLDDASTDNTRDILARHEYNPRVRVFLNRRNSGSPFKQWNKGVALARGQFVWIAEGDDYADPDFLATVIRPLVAHARVGVSYCQSWVVDHGTGKMQSYSKYAEQLDPEHWQTDYVNSGREECCRYLIYQNTIPNASAVVFRKNVFLRVGGAPEDFRLCGDWMTWIKILSVSDVAFTARPLNYFRRHSGTVRSRLMLSPIGIAETCRILDHMHRYGGYTKKLTEERLQGLCSWWLREITRSKHMSKKKKLLFIAQTYLNARRYDPHLARRIMRYLMGYLLR